MIFKWRCVPKAINRETDKFVLRCFAFQGIINLPALHFIADYGFLVAFPIRTILFETISHSTTFNTFI